MIVKFSLQWYFFFRCITKSHHREMIHQNRKVISAESHQCRNMPYIRKDPIYFSFREYISIPIILTKIFYGLVLLLIDLLLIWLNVILNEYFFHNFQRSIQEDLSSLKIFLLYCCFYDKQKQTFSKCGAFYRVVTPAQTFRTKFWWIFF